MTNPFEPPRPPPGTPTPTGGTVQIGPAFQAGIDAMQRNFLPLVGAYLVVLIGSGMSLMMCLLPALVVVPLLTYGWTRLCLDAVDGDADFGVVLSGFDRVSELLAPMLLLIVLLFFIELPGVLFGMGTQFVVALITGASTSMFDPMMSMSDDPGALLATLMGQQVTGLCSVIVTGAWSAVVGYRFLPAIFLVVEHEREPMDALSESWKMTEPSWGALIGVGVALRALAYVGGLFFLCCCLPPLVAYLAMEVVHAAVYRQLVPKA